MAEEYLEQIAFTGFRNLIDARIDLAPGLTLVGGANGQGKTNLLEAVYLLGTTKSFRTSSHREMLGLPGTQAVVSGQLAGSAATRLAVRLQVAPPSKSLVRGARAVTPGGYLGALNPVAFTAETRDLITGPPEGRRAFVDRGAATAGEGYLADLAAYRRALRQKARLLEARARRAEVEAWNAELSRRAAAVTIERMEWLGALKKKLPGVAQGIFGAGKEISIRYLPSPPDLAEVEEGRDKGIAEGVFASCLARRLSDELQARRVLVGPQRDEIEVWIDGRPGALYSSAGEQRRAAFVLVMAATDLLATRRGAAVLLVDDVEAEFDDRRLEQVFAYLAGVNQVLVASSKAEVARRFGRLGSTLRVERGRIEVG